MKPLAKRTDKAGKARHFIDASTPQDLRQTLVALLLVVYWLLVVQQNTKHHDKHAKIITILQGPRLTVLPPP